MPCFLFIAIDNCRMFSILCFGFCIFFIPLYTMCIQWRPVNMTFGDSTVISTDTAGESVEFGQTSRGSEYRKLKG